MTTHWVLLSISIRIEVEDNVSWLEQRLISVVAGVACLTTLSCQIKTSATASSSLVFVWDFYKVFVWEFESICVRIVKVFGWEFEKVFVWELVNIFVPHDTLVPDQNISISLQCIATVFVWDFYKVFLWAL